MGDRFQYQGNNLACNLCDNPSGDVTHLCTTCTHPIITARRNASSLNNIGIIMLNIAALFDATDGPLTRQQTATHAALRNHASLFRPDDDLEGSFLSRQLTTGFTWPFINIPNEWLLAVYLKQCFERIKRGSDITKASDAWVLAAETSIRLICNEWTELLTPASAHHLAIIGGHTYAPTRKAARQP